MPNTPSITIVKRFSYRGQPEEWSNTYHFSQATPANDAAWRTLGDAIIAEEKKLYLPNHSVCKVYGYAAGVDNSVHQRDFVAEGAALVPGTLSNPSGFPKMAGDQASWVRGFIKMSSKGKKVYVRKYYHGGFLAQSDPDSLHPDYKAALTTFVTGAIAGTLITGFKWTGPQAEAATLPLASTFVTTRTLKRRGKRPTKSGG